MTPTRQLVDLKLDGELDNYVSTRRADGRSWRAISQELFTATGMWVTDQTLRVWYVGTSAPTLASGPADERYCAGDQ